MDWMNEGVGEIIPEMAWVTAHAIVTLENGTEVSSTRDHGAHLTYRIKDSAEVIKGIIDATRLMRKESRARVTVPSALAYKDRRHGSIPRNSVLIVDLEIIDWQPNVVY